MLFGGDQKIIQLYPVILTSVSNEAVVTYYI